jgi:large subunit ribosomal protein L30
MSTVKVTYRRSVIGHPQDIRSTVAALGLSRLSETVEVQDNEATRGMIHKVRHLVAVDGVPADARTKS